MAFKLVTKIGGFGGATMKGFLSIWIIRLLKINKKNPGPVKGPGFFLLIVLVGYANPWFFSRLRRNEPPRTESNPKPRRRTSKEFAIP